jgi:membrane fusion protein (multidrug efflux system)
VTVAKKNPTKMYLALGAVALIGAAAYGGFHDLTANRVNTDDAQLEADVVPMSARVSGAILHVNVADNQTVKKGDLIAEIDPVDYEARVAQAEAEVEAALSLAETSGAKVKESDKDKNPAQNAAAVAAARANLSRLDAELRKADADLQRAKKLRVDHSISPVEFETTQNTYYKARAAQLQAAAQIKVAEEQHGVAEAKVKAAQAALLQARSQLSYTKIVAPRDGMLSKIAVQEGQMVQPGQLVAQVVDNKAFIVANFKETQVGRMKPGQPAEIEVDAFPGHKFEGKVESLSAATGARFSLLPPDNASGNFVKVVQRVPVKILLDKTPADINLRAGLSADVTVYFK